MVNIYGFIRNYWFFLTITGILLLATILRFYDYDNRWGLAYDQAHDAIIARYALENGKIPLLGPFSSAGPFQTGGQWYWIIMLGTMLFPFWINGPWVFITLLYILFVFLIALFATELLDRRFGIIVGLLAAVSTAQINQSVNLTNQSPHALLTVCALWAMLAYVRGKNPLSLFFMGLCVSTAVTIHLQGASLFLLPIVTLLFTGKPTIKGILYLLLGCLLPLASLMFYDAQHDFFNSKNMVTYMFFNENKISYEQLGRRWITYLGVFWPSAWALVVGGYNVISYGIIGCIGVVVLSLIYKKKLSKEWWIIITTFTCMIFLLRYIRTPLFDSYLVFMHPFIILTTGFLLHIIMKKKLFIGLLLTSIIITASFTRTVQSIASATNYMAIEANYWKNLLIKTYPHKKFTVYDYRHQSSSYSYPFVFYLYYAGKIDDNGHKISFGGPPKEERVHHKMIEGNKMRFEFWDLSSSSSAALEKVGLVNINPSKVYKATQEWYK